ncbi:MAG: hypothetical protein WAT88_09830, partial [Saprospiraceae bacterium]
DTRMVSNALRSLSNFDYQQVKTIILTAIRHSSISVATAALNYLNDFGREADANEYRNIARETYPGKSRSLCWPSPTKTTLMPMPSPKAISMVS